MEASNPVQVIINYALIGMEVVSSRIAEPNELLPLSNSINFFINIEHQYNLEEDLLSSFSTFVLNNSDTNETYASIIIKYDFNVENLKTFFNYETKDPMLPQEFVVVVNSLSISSSRGIIHMLFNGTNLSNFILPIIDPTAIVFNKHQ